MAFPSPEMRAKLHRWREVIAGAAVAAAGLWIATRGGYVLGAVGAMVAAGGIGAAVTGARRLRFSQEGRGAGVVDLLEGQISYLSPYPGAGGFVAIPEIARLALVHRGGARVWRIAQDGGPTLLVPVDALGAERLFDVFAALPGLDMPALLRALAAPGQEGGAVLLWERPRGRVAGPPAGDAG